MPELVRSYWIAVWENPWKWFVKCSKTFNTSCTKSQNLNGPRLFSLPNQLKPGVKLKMKMLLEQRRQAMLQLHVHLGD